MSLQSRLSTLITAVGADIKALQKHTNRPIVQVTKTADQTAVVSGTWTKVTFNSVMWDTGRAGDAAQFDDANDRLYPRKAGIYLVHALIEWDANATGDRGLAWYRNGVLIRVCSYVKSPTVAVATVATVAEQLYLNPAGTNGEHLELYAWQNSGANRTISQRSKFGWTQMFET